MWLGRQLVPTDTTIIIHMPVRRTAIMVPTISWMECSSASARGTTGATRRGSGIAAIMAAPVGDMATMRTRDSRAGFTTVATLAATPAVRCVAEIASTEAAVSVAEVKSTAAAVSTVEAVSTAADIDKRQV